jgi:hypothetical protein
MNKKLKNTIKVKRSTKDRIRKWRAKKQKAVFFGYRCIVKYICRKKLEQFFARNHKKNINAVFSYQGSRKKQTKKKHELVYKGSEIIVTCLTRFVMISLCASQLKLLF